MKHQSLPQEGLKLIACAAMFIDHIGVLFFPESLLLRSIGRLAFPIYCFLLAEGARYTRDPMKYGLRLLVGLLLSEIPYDLALFGQIGWEHQSVMLTLFLAFLMAMSMRKAPLWAKPLLVIPFALLAELLHSDYGGLGVVLAAVFIIGQELPEPLLVQTAGVILVNLAYFTSSVIQPLAVFSMVPIALYSGKKLTRSKWLQWAFYLFYPVHLAVLWVIYIF